MNTKKTNKKERVLFHYGMDKDISEEFLQIIKENSFNRSKLVETMVLQWMKDFKK